MLKSMTPSRVAFKNDDAGEVEAVFATLNIIDLDGDVILPGAVKDGAPVIISSYGHGSWSGDLPVGKGTVHEVGDELVVKSRFFLDSAPGRDTFATVKGLAEMGEWSWSLQNVVSERGDWDGRDANIISSVGLVKEVSPVFTGAGINTRTLATKGQDLKFSEHCEAVVAALQSLGVRAEEVVALRTAKGKSLGDDASQTLAAIGEEWERIKSLIEQPEPPTDTFSDDVARILLARIAADQGVTIP